MSQQRGKLIVVEGGEGSGKSSCLRHLREQLDLESFVFTREPGGTDFAEHVRGAVVQRGYDCPPNAFEQLLLMLAARSHHVRSVIEPTLASGVHVICDRFAASTFAYQIVAGGADEWLRQLFYSLNDAACRVNGRVVKPDHWLWLDVKPEVGLARRGAAGTKNAFDEQNLEFHRSVRKGLRFFLRFRPHTRIDTTHISASEKQEQALVLVKDLCPLS